MLLKVDVSVVDTIILQSAFVVSSSIGSPLLDIDNVWYQLLNILVFGDPPLKARCQGGRTKQLNTPLSVSYNLMWNLSTPQYPSSYHNFQIPQQIFWGGSTLKIICFAPACQWYCFGLFKCLRRD